MGDILVIDYIKLPKRHRPNSRYTKCHPGLDLPVWFLDSVKAIDRNLYPVFHRWRYVWADVMTSSYGSLNDPRLQITASGNDLDWGWILTDNVGDPIPENKWHLWRWSGDWGICHVINIDNKDPKHLLRIIDRLHKQAFLSNMSREARMAFLQQKQEEEMLEKQKNADTRWKDINEENKGFMNVVKENFERRIVAPTNPQKEQIMSYTGQFNRSRTSRTLDDKEGGLFVPED